MNARRYTILAVACLATFAINLDTNIVNVALPALSRQLGAGTRDLQWIVDAYNLAFAALVLAGGSLGDRFGRRPALIGGLVGFALTSALGALCTSSDQLIAVRGLMGVCAALIFPTTLSIITNAFPERRERAAAIGIWGAVAGVAVAIGPLVGGALLDRYWWGSAFVALVPMAVVAAALALWLVPESRDPDAAGIDGPGLALGSATIGMLVYTIIEAPGRGWHAPLTIVGFLATAALAVVFVLAERRARHPMLEVSLFGNRAFSAASMSVTVAFFALFGFIFLVSQYFQFVRGYSALSTGVRILPVAVSIAVGAAVGPLLVARFGTRPVVMVGLVLLGGSFAWIATAALDEAYVIIVGQMILMGLGLGLTQVPATDSIMSVLPAAKAGIGSAVNDATREAGGTLGVAIIGSVYASVFTSRLDHSALSQLPAHVFDQASSSVGAALAIAQKSGGGPLTDAANQAFLAAFHLGCVVGAGVCWAGALAALALPGRGYGRDSERADDRGPGAATSGPRGGPATATV